MSGDEAKTRTMNMWHRSEKQRGRLLGVGYAVKEAEEVATDTEGAGG